MAVTKGFDQQVFGNGYFVAFRDGCPDCLGHLRIEFFGEGFQVGEGTGVLWKTDLRWRSGP
jgi:hypothetical protein